MAPLRATFGREGSAVTNHPTNCRINLLGFLNLLNVIIQICSRIRLGCLLRESRRYNIDRNPVAPVIDYKIATLRRRRLVPKDLEFFFPPHTLCPRVSKGASICRSRSNAYSSAENPSKFPKPPNRLRAVEPSGPSFSDRGINLDLISQKNAEVQIRSSTKVGLRINSD